jgi:hypothetical protein
MSSAKRIAKVEELLQIMWCLSICSFLSWKQLWAEYISPAYPEEDCLRKKKEMEDFLGYPQLHFGEEGDDEECTRKGQVPIHTC